MRLAATDVLSNSFLHTYFSATNLKKSATNFTLSVAYCLLVRVRLGE